MKFINPLPSLHCLCVPPPRLGGFELIVFAYLPGLIAAESAALFARLEIPSLYPRGFFFAKASAPAYLHAYVRALHWCTEFTCFFL